MAPPVEVSSTRSPSLSSLQRGINGISPPHVVSRKPIESSGNFPDSATQRERKRYQFGDDSATSANGDNDPTLESAIKLEAYQWGGLERDFKDAMEGCRGVEDGLWQEWRGWGEVRFISLLCLLPA